MLPSPHSPAEERRTAAAEATGYSSTDTAEAMGHFGSEAAEAMGHSSTEAAEAMGCPLPLMSSFGSLRLPNSPFTSLQGAPHVLGRHHRGPRRGPHGAQRGGRH